MQVSASMSSGRCVARYWAGAGGVASVRRHQPQWRGAAGNLPKSKFSETFIVHIIPKMQNPKVLDCAKKKKIMQAAYPPPGQSHLKYIPSHPRWPAQWSTVGFSKTSEKAHVLR